MYGFGYYADPSTRLGSVMTPRAPMGLGNYMGGNFAAPQWLPDGLNFPMVTPPQGWGGGLSGLGCGSCRGTCGMGLFDSGMDFSQWTWAEWGAIAVGSYVLFSVVSTTNRGARRVSRKARAAARA